MFPISVPYIKFIGFKIFYNLHTFFIVENTDSIKFISFSQKQGELTVEPLYWIFWDWLARWTRRLTKVDILNLF